MKAEYGILDGDAYNMDENGYMMGIADSSKVVFSKYQKQAFINQPGNREWASLIEAISTTGERLPLFIILKGKRWKNDWFTPELEPGDRISLSENGWTDNKLCMKWREECFVYQILPWRWISTFDCWWSRFSYIKRIYYIYSST